MATRGNSFITPMKRMASSIVSGNRLACRIYLMCCLGAIANFNQAAGQENGRTDGRSSSQKTSADSKAIQALKAKVKAISKSFPNPNQSEDKVKAVLAAITAFAEANPGLVSDAVQAAITEMGATKAEVGALVSAAVQIAPGQAQAIANGAYAVAPDAFAEIQAAAPGVTFGPGNPLGSPGGGNEGGPGGNSGGSGPDITPPPKVTETGFIRRR